MEVNINKFSDKSQKCLNTCTPGLQRIFNEVLKIQDCTILSGYRDKNHQDTYFEKGLSKLPWPKSKHNHNPSKAIDAVAYIRKRGASFNMKQCYYFAGIVKGVASSLGIKIRWGGDWDGDGDVLDQSFNDLVHFEEIE